MINKISEWLLTIRNQARTIVRQVFIIDQEIK